MTDQTSAPQTLRALALLRGIHIPPTWRDDTVLNLVCRGAEHTFEVAAFTVGALRAALAAAPHEGPSGFCYTCNRTIDCDKCGVPLELCCPSCLAARPAAPQDPLHGSITGCLCGACQTERGFYSAYRAYQEPPSTAAPQEGPPRPSPYVLKACEDQIRWAMSHAPEATLRAGESGLAGLLDLVRGPAAPREPEPTRPPQTTGETMSLADETEVKMYATVFRGDDVVYLADVTPEEIEQLADAVRADFVNNWKLARAFRGHDG